jgi:hypothetical protein
MNQCHCFSHNKRRGNGSRSMWPRMAWLSFHTTKRTVMLWTPPVDTEEGMEETIVPCLLHILLVLFAKIRKVGCPLMPHNVLSLIIEHVKLKVDTVATEAGQAWQLAVQWCIVAAQQDTQGDSLVAYSIDAVAETDNKKAFCKWAETRLDGTMGAKAPKVGASQAMLTSGTQHHAHGQIMAEVGRMVTLSLQVLGPLSPPWRLKVGDLTVTSRHFIRRKTLCSWVFSCNSLTAVVSYLKPHFLTL